MKISHKIIPPKIAENLSQNYPSKNCGKSLTKIMPQKIAENLSQKSSLQKIGTNLSQKLSLQKLLKISDKNYPSKNCGKSLTKIIPTEIAENLLQKLSLNKLFPPKVAQNPLQKSSF